MAALRGLKVGWSVQDLRDGKIYKVLVVTHDGQARTVQYARIFDGKLGQATHGSGGWFNDDPAVYKVIKSPKRKVI